MSKTIETINDCAVGTIGEQVVILRPPLLPMTKEKALRLAAWLVVLADDDDNFDSVLDAVKNC